MLRVGPYTITPPEEYDGVRYFLSREGEGTPVTEAELVAALDALHGEIF